MQFIRAKYVAFWLVASGFLAFAPTARALDQVAGERAAIESAIQKQFDAFSRDDAEAAFAMAAPPIRRMFGAPDTFMDMVRKAYGPVYHHRDAAFGELQAGPTQIVAITGDDGRHWLAFYQMVQDDDGQWRIKGCNLIEDPDQHV